MSTMTGTGTLLDARPDLRLDHGDHERFAHYAVKGQIAASAVEGTPIEALCGKTFVVSRDPKGLPICPDCQDLYNGLPID